MPEPLKQSEVSAGQDPSVAKQWDTKVSTEDKWNDFYAMADSLKICMMGSLRDGIGVRLFDAFPPFLYNSDVLLIASRPRHGCR